MANLFSFSGVRVSDSCMYMGGWVGRHQGTQLSALWGFLKHLCHGPCLSIRTNALLRPEQLLTSFTVIT